MQRAAARRNDQLTKELDNEDMFIREEAKRSVAAAGVDIGIDDGVVARDKDDSKCERGDDLNSV